MPGCLTYRLWIYSDNNDTSDATNPILLSAIRYPLDNRGCLVSGEEATSLMPLYHSHLTFLPGLFAVQFCSGSYPLILLIFRLSSDCEV